MAKKFENNKDFLIIEMTPEEAIDICNFGYHTETLNFLIDDNNNEVLNNDKLVYYVAVLNRVFGKQSFDKWYEHAIRYEEDIPYETKYYQYYADILNIN